MFASTAQRVQENTAEDVNERIRQRTRENVARYAHASPDEIDRRLEELDAEWDIERSVEMNFAGVVMLGCTLGAFVNRAWLLLPGIAAGFMVQHVLQGWCPPIPVLRRLGVRTQAEIDEEKAALKAIRGDFRHVTGHGGANRAAQALAAAER